ncbi:MAG: T9SS type A sorting domain-containing protein [Bacteroidia bacterium]|nr:T9SS type A sorting domain-containing protein [Bacteroidia bacterium]
MRLFFTSVLVLLSAAAIAQTPNWKQKRDDYTVNFYDVCNEAELQFSTVNKEAKGSGWKGYQRWRAGNEYKYYPDGQRDNVDPYFPENAWLEFLANNPTQQGKISYAAGWKELGPNRIDSISGHYAAGLGRIEDHFVDPNNANLMYVGSRSGGFWRSSDGGANWVGSTTDFLVASGVNSIAVCPTNSDSVLINLRNSRNGTSHGIYRSVDGGLTWTVTPFNPTNLGKGGLGSNWGVNKVVFHPRVKDLVFVTASDGLYRSTNNLATWTKVTAGSVSEIEFHPLHDNIVYIYDYYSGNPNRNLVLRSFDQGQTFSQSTNITANNNRTDVHFSISGDCNECFYFASGNGIWLSTDSAYTFTFINNPPENCGGFAVNDQDTSNMIYGYVDIDRTTDGGQTFVDATFWALGNTNGAGQGNQISFFTSTDYVHADLHPAKSVNGVFYVGTDGLFSKSTDQGLSWTNLSQGIGVRENYKLGASQSNLFRSISGSQDNGSSIKKRSGWLEFYGADGMEGIIHPLNDDWIISSLQYGGRIRTLDGGLTLGGVSPPGQSGSGSGGWEAPLAYDPNEQMTVYNFSDSIYVSKDFGSTWTFRGIPNGFTGTIDQAAIAENNSDIILISRGGNLEKSVDGGISFVSIKNNLPSYSIQDIAFDPRNDDNIIVVYARYQNDNQKVYLTTNGGTSWTNITYNLGNMPIQSVVIDHLHPANIYVGAEIGVFTKPMNGNSWSLYNTALPNCTVEELEVMYGSNALKAASWGRGMWEYTLVGREDYPSIVTTRITHMPTDDLPKESIDQFVTSTISCDTTLTSVWVEWSVNAPTFGNVIAMSNTLDSTWISNSPLPNYPAGTKMFFKVFAVGSNQDTSETYKFMYEVRPFVYCSASGQSGSPYISNVNLLNLNNSSSNTLYNQFTSPVLELYVDSTYTLSVTANTSWSSNDYGAWIDYDGDANFTNSETILYQIGPGNNATQSFVVPSTAAVGDTVVMRVRVSYWGNNPSPCGTTLGEVEDYLVWIRREVIPALAFSPAQLCENGSVFLQYTGTPVDSIHWTLSDGTHTVVSNQPVVTLTLPDAGLYDIHLQAWSEGMAYPLDSLGVIQVNAPTTGTDVVSSCDPLVWIDGNTYANSNATATFTLSNAAGCDSLVTLNFTRLNATTGTDVVTSCGPFTWIDGQTYTVSNSSATHTLINAAGCDSLVSLNLTIPQIDVSVSQNAAVLTSNASGLAYQWIDCNNGNAPLAGQTSQTFTATQNGSYAVIVSDGNCTDTSVCFQVTSLRLDGAGSSIPVVIYPNPNNGKFRVDFGEILQEVELSLYNEAGQLVHQRKYLNQKEILLDLELATGRYILQVKTPGGQGSWPVEIGRL